MPSTTRKLRASMSALDAIYQRRSVRNYARDKVKRDTLRTLLEAAVRAPTAVHEEPWLFAIVQDPALLKRISDRSKELWEPPPLEPGQAPSEEAKALQAQMTDPAFNVFYNAGTLIVIAARPLGPYVFADCWLAAENFMLAACALGLGTCPIGFAVSALNAPDIKAELRIPADAPVIAPIILGIPAAETPDSPRKEPEIVGWR
jgi:nitroreductase